MIFSPRTFALACAAILTPACSSFEGTPRSVADLTEPRALHEQGQNEEAWEILDEFEAEEFDLGAQRTFNVLAGDVNDAMGEWNRTLRFYEAAMMQPGPASEALRVEQRLLELGIELLEGKYKVLYFFTDRGRGIVTLENLAFGGQFRATRSEALARLAEYRYAEEDFIDAAQFYSGLLDPDLTGMGYEDLAAFRLGMCSYRRVQEGRLNGTVIMQGLDQFRAYLTDFPSGLHREEAEKARAELAEYLSQYHLMLANYYRRIDNAPGERFHLQLAAGHAPLGHRELAADLRTTATAAVAAERLQKLDEGASATP
jgi:hypothetical protein